MTPEILAGTHVLCNAVLESFPAYNFWGAVTPIDGRWEEIEDPADEQALYAALKGQNWIQVPPHFVQRHPGDLQLVTEEAFCCFLPAWLVQTLPNLDGENEVREFVTYMFSPKEPRENLGSERIFHRFLRLSPKQRLVVRSFMAFFAEHEPSKFVRNRASRALSLIDQLPL